MSLKILYNYTLNHLNTMALDASAAQVVAISDEKDLQFLPQNLPFFILSGGSNVLLPPRLDATVLLPRFLGINVVKQNQDFVLIDVMGGENWHNLVMHTVQNGWYGLENLALIPGLVGAAPVQNIGAYGVQLSDVLIGVKSFDLCKKRWHYLDNKTCQLGYRTSIFKQKLSSHLITCLRLKLHKHAQKICTNYDDLHEKVSIMAKQENRSPCAKDVLQAIIDIRRHKLPDPKRLANCGSFFKNPIVGMDVFRQILARYPNMPFYEIDSTCVKIPAGWLIDQVGLKGGGIAPILTHRQQALVLTNHAPSLANCTHVQKSAQFIIQSVRTHFAITLEYEPTIAQDATISINQSYA